MADETKFTPRFGRLRDLGGASGRRYLKSVQRRIARLAKPSSKGTLSRGRIQRGGAAGRMASFRRTAYSAHRMRRVVVKVYIARASKIGGSAGFSKHIGYLQRDGVDHSGNRGEIYDREATGLHADNFNARSQDDRHQFRLMVSPEDGAELGDLKPHIRTFMAGVERDLQTRLDWIAVDHHNTGQPHTHIVVRGRTDDQRDLVIAKDYLTKGLRRRASDLITHVLGPRRDIDIIRQRASEVRQDRWTGIDRGIEKMLDGERVEIAAFGQIGNRLDRALSIKRLRYLEQLGLAAPHGKTAWEMKPDWRETLTQMGRRGDIIRTITATHHDKDIANRLRVFDPVNAGQAPILGRVMASGPADEMRSQRRVLIEAVDGHIWVVNLNPNAHTAPPRPGRIIKVSRQPVRQRTVDQTIAQIAASHNGVWSDAHHTAYDPSATAAYRLAHKRRLEALRRAGITERKSDGSFVIGSRFERRALGYDQRRSSGHHLKRYPPGSLSKLAKANALTWLDSIDPSELCEAGFGGKVKRALIARQAWLRQRGLLQTGDMKLSDASRTALRQMELTHLEAAEAKASNREVMPLTDGARFNGRLERLIEAHQGQLALVGSENKFVLTPARKGMAAVRGRDITLAQSGRSLTWTIGRTRGLDR